MEKQKNANSDGKKIERDERGRLKKGVVLNPKGKKAGTLDFKTKWLRFIDKVAAQNKLTPDEVDEQLLAVAFKQAKDANYPFYKDIQDRIHGKAVETHELRGTGEGGAILIDDKARAEANKDWIKLLNGIKSGKKAQD